MLTNAHQDLTPILSIAPQSIASLAALHNLEPASCLSHLRRAFQTHLGFKLCFDTTFARHLSLMEGRQELVEKAPSLKGKERAIECGYKSFPLLASACPGWICYAEKTHGELLPYISNVKSPQQVMGSLVKDWIAPKLGLARRQIYHVSVMPCYDKKLEASRPDFATEEGNRDVDCVLTTGEVEKILREKGVDLAGLDESDDLPAEEEAYMPSLLPQAGTASGGYLHNAIVAAIEAQSLDGLARLSLDTKVVRGEDYVEYLLRSDQQLIFRGAKCYGFRNLQNVVRKVGREAGLIVTKGAAGKAVSRRAGGLIRKSARSSAIATPEEPERGYDFIEVMACPSGCVNGGGQIAPPKHPLPIKVDKEGMPLVEGAEGEYKIVTDEKDGHRLLSGKEWTARVEELYWQLGGARKIALAGDASVHESLRPYVDSLAGYAAYDKRAQEILDEMSRDAMDPGAVRHHLLRTQYRAVESEEINGLAVKW